MKIAYPFILFLACFSSFASASAVSQYCTEKNLNNIQLLYLNRNHETAKTIFQVLSCEGRISVEARRGQFVALIGGYMRENPDLIDSLLISANTVESSDAAKIYLDGLWFCSTKECRNKLKTRPFQLPVKDINNLLAETPQNPLTMPIDNVETLDVLWGYFFGSGDTKIVLRIYNLVRENWDVLNSTEAMDVNKRMILSAARWSLISLASQQELIRKVLENEKSPVANELLMKAKPK
jgi:hypothetical protein